MQKLKDPHARVFYFGNRQMSLAALEDQYPNARADW